VTKMLALVALALVALVVPSPAVGEATRETLHFETTIEACGNTIQVSGDLLVLYTVVQTPSGGFVFATHFQPQNISGTDQLGRLYRATGLTRDISVYTPAGGSTFTYVNRFHIVGTMGAPTFYASQTFHFTVTPSGELVAEVDKDVSVECK
jgi:hypothetical protein